MVTAVTTKGRYADLRHGHTSSCKYFGFFVALQTFSPTGAARKSLISTTNTSSFSETRRITPRLLHHAPKCLRILTALLMDMLRHLQIHRNDTTSIKFCRDEGHAFNIQWSLVDLQDGYSIVALPVELASPSANHNLRIIWANCLFRLYLGH